MFNMNTVNQAEYEAFTDKNLFCMVSWLKYLKAWRKNGIELPIMPLKGRW